MSLEKILNKIDTFLFSWPLLEKGITKMDAFLFRRQKLVGDILLAFILGVVLPVIFFMLFGNFTSATNRDILPPLSHPLEIIGCFGTLIFAMPGLLALFLIPNSGTANSLFDSLSTSTQSTIIISLCVLINFLCWLLFVSIIRYTPQAPNTTK